MKKKLFKPIFLLIIIIISSFIFLSYVYFMKQNSEAMMYIDVTTKKGEQILASKKIKKIDFYDMNAYQEFNLTFFSSTNQGGVEFRVKCLRDREVNLVIDNIKLYDLENHKLIFWESATNKPQKGPSWHATEDQKALDIKVVQMDSRVKTESWLYGPYLHNDSYGESLVNRKLCAVFRMKITDVLLPIYVAELSVVVNEDKELTDCLAHNLKEK